MGCDIHIYPEYRKAGCETEDPYSARWRCFGDRINPGRNYDIFTAMAGVRGYARSAGFEPRGFPDDAGYCAAGDNWLYVVDNGNDGEGTVTRERANRFGTRRKKDDYGREWCEHPDWHSHSWLTANEFEEALKKGDRLRESPSYWALLAALRSLESDGQETRLVFWFDN